MKNWIRWPGLIAFFTIVIVVVGGVYLFANLVVEQMIEYTGTRIVGAKVELDRTSLSVAPLGFTLFDLQVTDPDKPMTNAVQISRVKFALDGAELLRKKIIINEMSVEGMRVNTPRKTSGAIEKPKETGQAIPAEQQHRFDFQMPALEVPDINEILEKENLTSVTLIRETQDNLQTAKQQWSEKLASLPDKETFSAYQGRLNTARLQGKGDVVQNMQQTKDAVKELRSIRDDIRRDVETINRAKHDIQQDLGSLQKQIKDAVLAPQQDIDRLQNKYTLSPKGLNNISRLLFGEKINGWVEPALSWYQRFEPLFKKIKTKEQPPAPAPVARAEGTDIHFVDMNPLPDFLVRQAAVTIEYTTGLMRGQVRNVTSQQPVLGHPLTFNFFADKMKDVNDIELEGTFNHVEPAKSVDSINLHINKLNLKDYKLINNDNFPLTMKNAMVDLKLNGELKAGKIAATIVSTLQSVAFDPGVKKDAGSLVKAMGTAISDVKAFEINADISGTLDNYDLKIRSDLDEVLRNAVGKQVQAKAQEFEQELKDKISAKIQQPMANLQASLDDIKNLDTIVAERQKQGEALLGKAEQDVKLAVEQEKAKLEQKRKAAEEQAKRQAEEKKKQADEEKRKAEEKAKQEQEKQKQKAEQEAEKKADKVKDKLKDKLKF
jgi:uncharacterized protein (TIGR03545 family)